MGRPPKKIDRQDVEDLIARGETIAGTSLHVGCSPRTLRRRFATAIKKGRMRRNSSLQAKQFEQAMAGDRTMLIWMGKQWLGQRDRMEQANVQRIAVDWDSLTKSVTEDQPCPYEERISNVAHKPLLELGGRNGNGTP